MGHATVTITIHRSAAVSSARRPAFVSPSAQSIAISVYSVDGGGNISANPISTTYADLTGNSPDCTGDGTITCSIPVAVPPGTDAFGLQLFAYTGEGGSVLGSVAPTAATERTITAGQNNVLLPLVVGGVPANVTISTLTLLRAGTPASNAMTVVATDAAGNVIVGSDPYANPIVLTDSDTSGATSLSQTTLTSPATPVLFSYNGGALSGPPTISGTVSGGYVTPASIQYLAGNVAMTCSAGCSGLTNGPQPYPLTISESGYDAQPFSVSVNGSGCSVDPSGSVQASNGSAVVNVYGPPAGGTCTVYATDIGADTTSANAGFAAAANPTIVSTCGDALPKPPDPYGVGLYVYVGCGNVGVLYGSYLFVPLDSYWNPLTFQIAAYANPNEAAITQFTISGGNRYITSVAISSPNVVFNGQAGGSNVPFTSLVP